MKTLQSELRIYKDETTYLDVTDSLMSVKIDKGSVNGYLDSGIDGAEQKMTFVLSNSDTKNYNPLMTKGQFKTLKLLLNGNGTNYITYELNNVIINSIGVSYFDTTKTVIYDNYTLATYSNYELQNFENYTLENGSVQLTMKKYVGNIKHDGTKFIFDEIIQENEWVEIYLRIWDTTIINDINYLNGSISSLLQANAFVEYYETYGTLETIVEEVTIGNDNLIVLSNTPVKSTYSPYLTTNTNVSNDVLYKTTFKHIGGNVIMYTNDDLKTGDKIGVIYSYVNGSKNIKFKGKLGEAIESTRNTVTCVVNDQTKPLRRFFVTDELINGVVGNYTNKITLDTFLVDALQDCGFTLLNTTSIGTGVLYEFSNNIKLFIEDLPLFEILPDKENIQNGYLFEILQYYVAQSTYWIGVEYNSQISDIGIIFRLPPRDYTTPVLTVTSNDILRKAPITISDKNARDEIIVKYYENGEPKTYTATNTNSILEIKQKAVIDLGNTSAIDTTEEAQTLANAILNDLSTVQGQVSLETHYHDTEIRFFDTINFYDELISSDIQNLFVESISYSLDYSNKTISFTYAGSTKVSRGYFRKWLKISNFGKKYENVNSTNLNNQNMKIGDGATSQGNNGMYLFKKSTDINKLDTVFEFDANTGQFKLQSENGDVLFQNANNRIKLDSEGLDSQILLNVPKLEWETNTTWQIGSVNNGSYIKYWFDSTENKDKLKISVDEFQLQGNNILRGLSFYYLVKDDTLPSGTSNSNMIEYEGVLVYATPYRFGAFNFVRSDKTTGINNSIQLKYNGNYTVLEFIKNSNGNLFALIYNSTNYNLKLIKINSVYDNSTTNITELKDFGNTPIFTNKFTVTGSINNGNDLYFYVTDSNFDCVLYKFDTINNTYISKNLNIEAIKILNFKNKIYLLTFGYLYRIDSSLNTEIITSNSPINIATTNNYLFLIYDFDIYYSGTGDSNSFTILKQLENDSFYFGYNSASYNLKTYIPISNGHALVVDDSLNAEEIFIQEKNFSFYSCSFGLFFIYEYNNLEQYGIGDVVSYNLTTKL